MLKTNLKAQKESIPVLLDYIENQCIQHNVGPDCIFKALLISDEIVSNICIYTYGENEGDIQVELLFKPEYLSLRFIDSGMPSDPTGYRTSEKKKDELGRLGISLVRMYSQKLNYERAGNKNIVTVSIEP